MARNKDPEATVRLILNVSEKLFLKKGYDGTSIQDIISGLGGLSKGAVYHHFKSKEEIFDAVGNRLSETVAAALRAVRDDGGLSGLEKLKKMFQLSLSVADRDVFFAAAPNLLDKPKLLAAQLQKIYVSLSPDFIRPVIEQGIRDGSIRTAYPQELSELLLLLTNLWLNPMMTDTTPQQMERRIRCFNALLSGMGIELLDPQMLEGYLRYCALVGQTQTATPTHSG